MSMSMKNYLRMSVLVGVKMKEAYSISKMKRTLIADYDDRIPKKHKYKTLDEEEVDKMNKYIASYGANGEKEVIYNFGFTSIADYGRIYAPNSFGSFWSYVKNTVSSDDYIDIDMVNSQANIIWNIAIKDLDMNPDFLPMLKDYIFDRNKILNEIMREYKVDARLAKLLMTSLMNGGELGGWKKENEIHTSNDVNECNIFRAEIVRIADRFFNHYYDIEEAVRGDSKFKTITGGKDIRIKLFSRVCKNTEILCLEKLYLKCGSPIYGSLEHDGLRIKRSLFSDNCGEDGKPVLKEVIAETLLDILDDKDLGYDIQFIVKEAVDFLPMSEKTERDGNFEYFDEAYFESIQQYDDKKSYFEIFHFKVMLPRCTYYQLSWSEHDYGKLVLYETTDDQITKSYRNRKYTKMVIEEKENAKGEIVKIPKKKIVKFTETWLDDPEIRTYHNVDFIPSNKIATKLNYWDGIRLKTYNTFFGYSLKCNTPIPEKGNNLLRIWSDLVFELCGENQKFYDLYVNSLAHKIQYPNDKPKAGCFVFKSRQGEGKNMSLVPFEVLLGEYFISSSEEANFFGAYADGYYRKILINLNEMQLGKDSRDDKGNIKAFITEEWKLMNQKFKPVVKVRNTALLVFYTNEQQPFAIDFRTGERRLNVAEGTGKYLDKKKYNTKFWADMNTKFRSDEFIATFYNFLNTKDLSKVDWSQVKTEAYMDMGIKYHTSDMLFICDWIERKILGHNTMNQIKGADDPIPTRYTVASVFDDYKQFCSDYNIKPEYVLPQHKFMTNLVDLKIGITSKRSSVNVFDMDLDNVKKILLERGFIKADTNLMPIIEDEDGGMSLDDMYDL